MLSLEPITGDSESLVKLRLPGTTTLIGVFLCSDSLNTVTSRNNQMDTELSFWGFYSEKTEDFYALEKNYMTVYWKMPNKKIEFSAKPLPNNEMQDRVLKKMTEILKSEIDFDPSTMECSDSQDWLKQHTVERGVFLGVIERSVCITEDMLIEPANRTPWLEFTNREVEQFLTDPDSWVNQKVEQIFAARSNVRNKDMTKKEFLRDGLVKRMECAALVDRIKQMPNHPWNKIKRIRDATRNKKTVTVEAKAKTGETYTFKIAAKAFGSFMNNEGETSVLFVESGMRDRVREAFGWNLTVLDIQNVQYKGKKIYEV